MRSSVLAAAGVAAALSVPFVGANPAPHPHPTAPPYLERRADDPALSTSFSASAGLLLTSGQRFYTTVSVPVVITLSNAAPTSSSGGGSSSGSGGSSSGGSASPSGTTSGGGNSSVGNSTISTTQSAGGNNTAIISTATSTSSTPTTLPFAPTTIEFGGGGTTVPAPVPGSKDTSLPQGPGDGYHTGSAHLRVIASVVGIIVGVGSVAAVQLSWAL